MSLLSDDGMFRLWGFTETLRDANENLKAGFILKQDAESVIRYAKAIGRLQSLEAEPDRPLTDFDRAP